MQHLSSNPEFQVASAVPSAEATLAYSSIAARGSQFRQRNRLVAAFLTGTVTFLAGCSAAPEGDPGTTSAMPSSSAISIESLPSLLSSPSISEVDPTSPNILIPALTLPEQPDPFPAPLAPLTETPLTTANSSSSSAETSAESPSAVTAKSTPTTTSLSSTAKVKAPSTVVPAPTDNSPISIEIGTAADNQNVPDLYRDLIKYTYDSQGNVTSTEVIGKAGGFPVVINNLASQKYDHGAFIDIPEPDKDDWNGTSRLVIMEAYHNAVTGENDAPLVPPETVDDEVSMTVGHTCYQHENCPSDPIESLGNDKYTTPIGTPIKVTESTGIINYAICGAVVSPKYKLNANGQKETDASGNPIHAGMKIPACQGGKTKFLYVSCGDNDTNIVLAAKVVSSEAAQP